MVRKSGALNENASAVSVLYFCSTWCDVSHPWNLFQALRTDTSSWTVAQLQHEVVAVLTFPYTRRRNHQASIEIMEKRYH